jgi:hypothetical protein
MAKSTASAERARIRSDEELCNILVHESDYAPEAVEAAREELGRRHTDPGEWQGRVDKVTARTP